MVRQHFSVYAQKYCSLSKHLHMRYICTSYGPLATGMLMRGEQDKCLARSPTMKLYLTNGKYY